VTTILTQGDIAQPINGFTHIGWHTNKGHIKFSRRGKHKPFIPMKENKRLYGFWQELLCRGYRTLTKLFIVGCLRMTVS
jgi:hypothetical protein